MSVGKAAAVLAIAGALAWLLFSKVTTSPAEAPAVAPGDRTESPAEEEGVSDAPAELVARGTDEVELAKPVRRSVESSATQEPTPTRPPGALPFNGVVVDLYTSQPVPAIEVRSGGFIGTTDIEGRVSVDGWLMDTVELFEAFTELGPLPTVHLATLDHDDLLLTEDGESWTARLPIGPTFQIELGGVAHVDPMDWRVRLIATAFEKSRGGWKWIGLRPPTKAYPHMWVRFDERMIATEDFEFTLEVMSRDGTRGGAVPVDSALGVYPEVVRVPIDSGRAVLKGRVTSETGRELMFARVLAVPADGPHPPTDPDGWIQASTRGDGLYEMRGIPPGRYWVNMWPPRGEAGQTREIELAPGTVQELDFVAPYAEDSGVVSGRLESRGGVEFGHTLLRLRSRDGSGFTQVISAPATNWAGQRRKVTETRFRFAYVPPGEYTLSVVPLDGHEWSPKEIRVTSPGSGYTFLREDTGPTRKLAFRVIDDETGRPIDEFFTQFQGDHYWYPGAHAGQNGVPIGEYGPGTRVRWNLHAPGYQLATGDETDFTGDGEVRYATVRLQRGWGATFLCRDNEGFFGTFDTEDWQAFLRVVERPPVPGVEVWADGRRLGVTDGTGALRVQLPAEPKRIEFRANGWNALGSEHFQNGRIVGDPREVVIWMMRE